MSRFKLTRRFTGMVLLLGMLNVFIVPSLAQTGDQADDYTARFVDIPQSRTEDGAFVLGEPDAPLTIVEFADFMCPGCQAYYPTVSEFIDQYVRTGQAKFEYRMFPVVSPEYSEFTAQLAECVAEQDELLFWPAHDLLYDLAIDQQIDFEQTPATLVAVLGLDEAALNACIETADQFETDYALGTSLSVPGTPSVLLRLEDGALGWPYFDEPIGSGGLTLDGLEELITAEEPAENVLVPEPLLDSLLTGEPCAVPCWNGITPGETTYEEATAIVEENRQFLQLREENAPEGSAVLLSWLNFDGNPCCQLYSEEGEIVDELFLLSTAPLTLSAFLEARDAPANALARVTENGDVIVNLFYPESRLVVYAYISSTDELELTEETDVIGASLVTDEQIESLLTDLQPAAWEGIEALDAYLAQPAIATEEAEGTDESTEETVVTDEAVMTAEADSTDEPVETAEAIATEEAN